jgi:hypothetical protein
MTFEVRVFHDDVQYGLRQEGFKGGQPNLGTTITVSGKGSAHELMIEERGYSDFPRSRKCRPPVGTYIEIITDFQDLEATGQWERICF